MTGTHVEALESFVGSFGDELCRAIVSDGDKALDNLPMVDFKAAFYAAVHAETVRRNFAEFAYKPPLKARLLAGLPI